jgi:hypothetical protein
MKEIQCLRCFRDMRGRANNLHNVFCRQCESQAQQYPVTISPHGRSGNITRIIDSLVQELFETSRCRVWDNEATVENHNKILRDTRSRLAARLVNEHPHVNFKITEHWLITLI